MLSQVTLKMRFYEFYRQLWPEICFTFCYASLIYYLYEHHELTFLTSFNFLPVGFLGAVLSVFLAFRNNSAYDRWWEARRLWGELVNASRTFAMQLGAVLPPDIKLSAGTRIIKRHIAYINLLRKQLRQDPNLRQPMPLMSEEEWNTVAKAANAANAVILLQSEDIRAQASQYQISDYKLVMLLNTLEQFYDIQGGCERIKNTPFPRQFDEFIRMLLWILTLILPIYLLSLFSDDLSKLLMIPLATCTIMVLGFANMVGKTLENPFDNSIHDIPMCTLCETITQDILPDGLMRISTLSPNTQQAAEVLW